MPKMKEFEIRPKDTAERSQQLRIDDIKSIFYKDGKIRLSNFVEVSCPACGMVNDAVKFEKEGFHFKTCEYCNTLYISPRPNQKKLLDYYKHSKSINYFTREILEKTKKIRREKIFEPRAERIINILKNLDLKKNVLVDVGGGNGLFLEVMKAFNSGFKRYINIELSKEGTKLTEDKGIEVVNDLVENINFDFEVNLITAFELVEHLFEPLEFFKKINSILGNNGIFIFTIPNVEGFDLVILDKNSDNIVGPNHLNYFNPSSIRLLCERGGFEIIQIETPGILDVDIVKNKMKEGIEIKDSFVSCLMRKDDRVLTKFQNFLQENNLSSHMIVVARKRE